MRIAIFSPNREKRYFLSRLAEDALLRRGILPEVVMFPLLSELTGKLAQKDNSFAIVFISDAKDTPELRKLCHSLPVILIGEKADVIEAYDIGAMYFLANPIEQSSLDKAIARCLS